MLDLGHNLATGGLVGIDEGLADPDAIVIVHEGDGNFLDTLVEYHLGQHRALVVV